MRDDAPSAGRTSLGRELGELLIDLSIGVHRYAMYPPGHPSLDGVVESLLERLAGVLDARGSLAIGVAQDQLVIEGTATDPRHPLLADLARRLHEHQLGAVSLERGIDHDEVAGLLEVLGHEPEREGVPLGLRPEEEMPRWPHARLHRVGYEHLRLREGAPAAEDDPGADRAMRLWLGLAQVSLASEEPLTEVPDATTVARSISGHRREAAYDQAVVGYLLQLTEQLKDGSGGGSESTRRRVSRLVRELDEPTLRRLVEFGGNVEQRRRFVRDASQSLTAESVLKVLQAAATSSHQTISHSMTRLLTKLAAHADEGSPRTRSHAETALRENIEALLADWALEDPNPDAYTLSLDAMARAAPVLRKPNGDEGALAEVERLMEMALEIDVWGPTVERVMEELVAEGGSLRLLRMLEKAPRDNQVARRAWERLGTVDELHRLMHDAGADVKALRALVIRIGEPAVDPLLDVLSMSEDRALRRRAFDVLRSLRSDWITDRVIGRLGAPEWYVQRNMLALLLQYRPPLDHLDLMPWCQHGHPRVRREALALMMTSPARRELAMIMALEDEDERVVWTALPEIGADASPAVLLTLAEQVLLDFSRSEELRVAAVRAVAASRSPLAADALVDLVTDGRTILRRRRLAPPEPAVLEALRVLASTWAAYPPAREVLRLARRSGAPALRAAADLTGVAEPGGAWGGGA